MADVSVEEGRPRKTAFLKEAWTRSLSTDLLAEVQIGGPTQLPALPLSRSMTTAIGHVQSSSTNRPHSSRPGSSANRYTPIGTLAGNDLGKSLAYVPPISAKDCLEELKEVLLKPLEKVSRQRLRAILYGFRRKGGLENRIPVQHMNSVLLEHDVHLSSRIIMLIRKSYEGKYGIDYESLWKLMCTSQAMTGRDSVICMHGPDSLPNGRKESVSGTGIDPRDRELITRLKHEFMSSREHNLAEIRDLCEERDTLRHGLLQSRVLSKICEEQRLPVSKPLLTLLLARCDDEKNGHISWTDFVGLLEKAYSELPEMPVAAQRPHSLKTRSETTLSSSQLPAIGEQPTKADKAHSKRKTATKPAKKGRRQTPSPPHATQTDEDLSNEEADPHSTSSTSITSKNSSQDENAFLSESIGGVPNANGQFLPSEGLEYRNTLTQVVTEVLSSEDSQIKEGDSVVSNSQDEKGDSKEGDVSDPQIKSTNVKTKRLPSKGKSKTDVIGKIQPLSGIAGKIKAKVNKKTVTKKASSIEGEPGISKDDGKSQNQDGETSGNHSDEKSIGSNDEVKNSDLTCADVEVEACLEKEDGGETITKEKGDELTKVDMEVNCHQPEGVATADNSENEGKVEDKEENGPEEAQMEYEVVEYSAGGQNLKFYKPDSLKDVAEPTQPPDKSLKLDWVYGYQGNDCRNNLFAMATGELVYFSAHIVVLYDPLEHRQRYYLGHESPVQSLAVHINGTTVASGQSESGAAQACVHIWNGSSLQTLLVLGLGVFRNGITCLDFAASHGYLLVVDASPNPVLSVWDWKNDMQFASASIGTDSVCQVRFQPKDPSVVVSAGKDHLVFWSLDKEGGKLEETTKPNFERNTKAKHIICITFRPNGDIVTGDSNGTVYVWPRKSNTISLAMPKVHEGPVYALRFLRGLLITGGRDGKVVAWNLGSRGAKEMCCSKLSPDAGGARTLAVAGSRIFVGTTMNCIYSIGITPSGPPFDSAAKMEVVTQGHYEEVIGITSLAVQPFQNHFMTAGCDGVISLVDGCRHHHVWRHWSEGRHLLCVDVSGGLLAVGTKEGSTLILTFNNDGCEDLTQLSGPKSSSPIVCIKFSPDGKRLAAGNSAGSIHLHEVSQSGKKLVLTKHLEGHQGSVRSLDWSADGQFMRSSADSAELFVWNMQSLEKGDNLAVRNYIWASHQSLLGFHCKGLWEQDKPAPRAVDVTGTAPHLLLAAEDHRIDIHHYPSNQTHLKTSVTVLSVVSNLRFLSGDSHVITVGGGTASLQWSLVDG